MPRKAVAARESRTLVPAIVTARWFVRAPTPDAAAVEHKERTDLRYDCARNPLADLSRFAMSLLSALT
jgi:hypothetical protein